MPHQHNHSHGHSQDPLQEVPFDEKIKRLLAHWQSHNNDHIATYRKWSLTCEKEGFENLKPHFDRIVELTETIGNEIDHALMKVTQL